MKKLILSIILVIAASQTGFAEKRQLTGSEIGELLLKIEAIGDGTWQNFLENGKTNYNVSGRESIGNWEVRGDQYCSNWPPLPEWACYDVLREGENTLIWVHANGDLTIDKIKMKKQ